MSILNRDTSPQHASMLADKLETVLGEMRDMQREALQVQREVRDNTEGGSPHLFSDKDVNVRVCIHQIFVVLLNVRLFLDQSAVEPE